ncbi:galectin-12 isoform X2 [Tamandua tetradactyla]|uniref:galectin-12 isoform X2 n=1 Tax=Tamandua tetradactyla TaxID=48850 RepID=UPI0040548282
MLPREKLDPLPDSFILQPPVFYPVIPYVTTIFGGLRAGKMVMLEGVVPTDARRFQVDFQCGCSLQPQPDIAIHFNPRFHTTKPHAICNTLQSGHWMAEARWPGLPLQRGTGFLILFLFGDEEVKVSVNGQHFLCYPYRLPLSRVDTLGVFGDIFVKAIGFLNINPFEEGEREYPVGYVSLLGAGLDIAVPSPHPSMTCLRWSATCFGQNSCMLLLHWGCLGQLRCWKACLCFSHLVSRTTWEDGWAGLAAGGGQGSPSWGGPYVSWSFHFSEQPCVVAGSAPENRGSCNALELTCGHTPFLLKCPRLEVPCSRALLRGLWPGQVIIVRGLLLPEPKDQRSK